MRKTLEDCCFCADELNCDVCKSQSIDYQELMQIKLMVAKAKLDVAKTSYNDIDCLLQTAKTNLCYALGEYEKALRKSINSLK